jgi:hypothetical protein
LSVSELEVAAEARREIEAVGHDNQDSTLGPLELEEQIGYRSGRRLIEISRRFVAQKELWTVDQGSSHRDAL